MCSPSMVPSPKGPPACGQVLSSAKMCPLRLKRAMPQSLVSRLLHVPGGRSAIWAIGTNLGGMEVLAEQNP